MNNTGDGFRVGWLDSVRMFSHLHRTIDGMTTICGHPFIENSNSTRWILKKIPGEIRGNSRYCKVCFSGVKHKKQVPWFPLCGEKDENIKK